MTAVEASAGSAPLLALRDIAKAFDGVTVLEGVSLTLRAGEVHALLGENGAGKSTLLKILSGAHKPDAGSIVLDGAPIRLDTPVEAQRHGIATIYQEFSQFPDLTVAENLRAGHLPRNRFGLVDWGAVTNQAQEALSRLGAAIDPHRVVGDLSVAEQQLVEVARALNARARIVIMDEPTAALSASEVLQLHAIIADLKAQGIGLIFVGHRLEEVMALCDRYTVLRDGRVAGTGRIAETTLDELVRLMVGRDIGPPARRGHAVGPTVLEVRGLSGVASASGRQPPTDISFVLRAGEVVGLAGLVGSGRSEIARALFGADPLSAGTVRLDGEIVTLRNPRAAIRRGLGFVPEDRKQQSLFLQLAASENFGAASLDRFAGPLGWMSGRERASFETFRTALGIRVASHRQPVATLSGGNQQKIVLARWLALRPKVLIVDEPTRGIDIAAKADVHHLLRELAQSGVAVLLISSDLPEILSLSDRILTLRAGRLSGELLAEGASEERVIRLMTLDVREAA